MDGQGLSWPAQTLGQVLGERSGEALVTATARFTYEDLLENARRAAGALQALGIRHGDRVGILMGNDEHWLALFYGAALIGAVSVPVNTRFKSAEIGFCLKQADCRLLVYAERFLGIDFGAMVRETGFANAIELSKLRAGRYAAVPVAPEDILLIQFTQGSHILPEFFRFLDARFCIL